MVSIKDWASRVQQADEDRMGGAVMEWVSSPNRSSSAGHAMRADSEDKTDRIVRPLGASKPGVLTDSDFPKIQNAWKILDPGYDNFWDRFNRMNTRQRPGKRSKDIADWNPPGLTEQEKRWQQMSHEIQVLALPSLCHYYYACHIFIGMLYIIISVCFAY